MPEDRELKTLMLLAVKYVVKGGAGAGPQK